MTFTPTSEQQECIDLYNSGTLFKVAAYAGCGKTSTLKAMARANPRRALYAAFNKAIADEAAKEFPDHVECRTLHSLAYHGTPRKFGKRKVGTLRARDVAKALNVRGEWEFGKGYANMRTNARVYMAIQTVRRFCQSAAIEIEPRHVPLDGNLKSIEKDIIEPFLADIAQIAREIWFRMIDPNGPDEVPLGFDGTVKLWALNRPQIDADVIFLDEAQDTNPVIIDLMRRQNAQVICVGDANQSIYEWRGATNAMETLSPDAHVARLTQTFRFGEGLADHATDLLYLLGETQPLRGNPAKDSGFGNIEKPDVTIARTNATLIAEAMDALAAGKKPYIQGGTAEIKAMLKAAEGVTRGWAVTHPDFIGFASWEEVQDFADKREGADIRPFVGLVDKFGLYDLIDMVEGLDGSRKNSADVVLTTGHKSKGLEWSSVCLASDFLRGVRTDEENREKKELASHEPPNMAAIDSELRLFYVASTRAMERLHIPSILHAKIEKIREMKSKDAAQAAA